MKYLLIGLVALVLIAGLAVFYPVTRTSYPTPPGVAPKLSIDLYPLYTGATWGEPVFESFQIGTTTYSGVSETSATIDVGLNPGRVVIDFENYYEDKLKALGYQEANELAAGGHVGGQVGYRKGAELLLTRFTIIYHNTPADAPSECPCDLTLSVFSSNN